MKTPEQIRAIASELRLDITDDCVTQLLSDPTPVVVCGASGGKDSSVLAIKIDEFLARIEFPGERLIIHSDLGRIEHAESIDHVRQLAAFINWPLMITRRQAGDLLDRYAQRWRDNCRRYTSLLCVTLISPWPAPQSPFCRSEVKVAPIVQALTKRYPGKTIISCVGLRAEESSQRARKPIFERNSKFDRSSGTKGFNWNPILSTPIEQVWLIHRKTGFPLHPQYLRGNTRLSCAYCFCASKSDLLNGSLVSTNQDSFRFITNLEIRSTFSYQSAAWLADINPTLLTPEDRQQLPVAKENASLRRNHEAEIPGAMLFRNHGGRRGWPASQPNLDDCATLASARNQVAKLLGDEIEECASTPLQYLTARAVYDRYAELLELRPASLAELSTINQKSQNHSPSLFANA